MGMWIPAHFSQIKKVSLLDCCTLDMDALSR